MVLTVAFSLLWRRCTVKLESVIKIELLSETLNYYYPIYRIPDFFIGCCIAKIKSLDDVNSYNVIDNLKEITVLILLILYGYAITHNNVMISSVCNDTFALILSGLLVYTFGFEKGYISRILSSEILVKIGNLSKYTYLIHVPVIEWMWGIEILGIVTLPLWFKVVFGLFITYFLTFVYMKMDNGIKTMYNAS